MARPKPTDAAEYFSRYISLVEPDSLSSAKEKYAAAMNEFYLGLPEEKADHRYAPGKWSLKELLLHIVDAERIFSYRLLRIVRGDQTPLASFDENSYAANSHADNRTFDSIKEEFLAVRKATDLLIDSVSEEQLAQAGVSSNHSVTANAIGYIIFGHMLHHKKVLEEKYL